MRYSLTEIIGHLNIVLVPADALHCVDRMLAFGAYFVTAKVVKSFDRRKVALFHFQNGKKAPEIAKLLVEHGSSKHNRSLVASISTNRFI